MNANLQVERYPDGFCQIYIDGEWAGDYQRDGAVYTAFDLSGDPVLETGDEARAQRAAIAEVLRPEGAAA